MSWLRSYCDPDWDAEELAEQLAMTGTEVERVGSAGAPSPEGFVVGRVKSVAAHPDADRLSVCEVDTGDGERTIVCGAPNVAAGQLVPVALPGAVLPGGMKLKKAKLRGVESDGMILSEAELEIGDDAGGIAVLGENGAAPGTPLADLLAVSDEVLELEVTSNRSDCLAIYGVAREVHAISEAPLAPAPWERDAEAAGEGDASDHASVSIETPTELCPRFTARVFTDVEIGPSPLWLKARLMAAGQRPINNVVDITNYVMLLTGQPLHAFDLDEVPGGELIIRTAKQGERMTTLDDVERTFDADAVLVCDREGPSGVAGIMGGQRSEVSETTTRVLLEVATWNGVNILRTSRMLALRSEASARFEKQLHPALTMRAQRVASQLMVELCGAKLVPGTIDEGAGEPEPRVVRLRVPRVERLVGLATDAETCEARLERLGFGVEREGEEISATVPPERDADVTREVDLIEEVARLAHLETALPSTLPATRERVGRLTPEQLLRREAEDALRGLGADEIVGWSLTDPGIADRLRLPQDDPRRVLIEIGNPLSADQSVLRPVLLGGLLDAARLNLARGGSHAVLFESGHVHRGGEAKPRPGALGGSFSGEHGAPVWEPHHLAYLATGTPPQSWAGSTGEPDYFGAKSAVETLFGRLGVPLEVEAAEQPFLHPGRTARLLLPGEDEIGWVGELHPLVARQWDLPGGVAFELALAPLLDASRVGREAYEDVTSFPAANQDIAVVVPEDVPASRVREVVLEGGGELLVAAEVFDLYAGEQVGEGNKSLALRLSFRAPDRTLTDEEVSGRRAAITSALAEIGGSLRE
ncbi:MAG TPA: phenylalanine--tRNA ligase subunit beta [Solirubrobacterales bacterium]|nr:phenylalanine--tRNA ligase subunit beta [Solirubrobacterales bacterium]